MRTTPVHNIMILSSCILRIIEENSLVVDNDTKDILKKLMVHGYLDIEEEDNVNTGSTSSDV